jgi:hypothetical protein
MQRRLIVLGAVVLACGAVGCAGIGATGITVRASEIPGTWRAACGETLVLAKDGTGTFAGFTTSGDPGGTGGPADIMWTLDSPGDPHLSVDLADGGVFWYMHFGRVHGSLRIINEAGTTCTFTRN